MTEQTHNPNILLVEDDADLRHLLQRNLSLEGFSVTGVGSAIECYQALAESNFDIAIVDIGLPDQSGLAVTEYLREKTNLSIIIMTAKGSADDRVTGYEKGADLYLVKPIDIRELTFAIKNLFSRMEEKQSTSKKQLSESWVFDQVNWTLKAPHGTAHQLSSKELLFINMLLKKPGEQVHRSDILDHLGYSSDEYGNSALEALVLRIRKKLTENSHHQDPIKTLRGIGYLFSHPVVTVSA
ncbi:MAG: response regulator transcription factor [Rhodospirillales bacterium]|nr:response regulator transcription factor [Rhodospirillales bacterium]